MAQYEASIGKEVSAIGEGGGAGGAAAEDGYERPGVGDEQMSDSDMAFAKFQKKVRDPLLHKGCRPKI